MSIVKYNETIDGLGVEIHKKSNLKNLYIRIIPPDGDVKVSVPLKCSDDEIKYFVLKNMTKIKNVKEKFRNQPRLSKREYVSGESCYLWGKTYILEVVYENKKPEVVVTSKKIILRVREGSDVKKRESIINEWYRNELKRVLKTVSKKCEKNTGLIANEYRVKNMKTKWGTCNINKKRIWINLQLAKKPIECLEYVMTHELVHLLERNHTNRFYELLGEYYPEWKVARKILSEQPLDYVE